MQSLQKQFHDFIIAHDLVQKGENVLLAVSGGLDSMVMAHLFLTEDISFAVAHCNYGLRGEESDGDEAFVLDWADRNDINCFVKSFDISAGSIQLEARNVRYQWFSELMLEHDFDKVATAHHLNDSLETILMNLTRGTGIKGASGISIRNDAIIRPLLFADRKKLYDFAMDQGLEWREDSSNTKLDYDRNLLRHEVVPELLKLNPSLFKTLAPTIERLQYASSVVDEQVSDIRKKHLAEKASGYELELSWIKGPTDLLILHELLSSFGANYVTSKEVFEALEKSGKSFPVSEWLITMDRNMLYIDRDEARHVSLEIKWPGEYALNEATLAVELVSKDAVNFDDPYVVYLDADRLAFPFMVRNWQQGDRFQPLGMKGEKKVSDYLIDTKVPLSAKQKVLVIECNDQISWLVGMRISEQFKIREDTTNFIKITFIPANS